MHRTEEEFGGGGGFGAVEGDAGVAPAREEGANEAVGLLGKPWRDLFAIDALPEGAETLAMRAGEPDEVQERQVVERLPEGGLGDRVTLLREAADGFGRAGRGVAWAGRRWCVGWTEVLSWRGGYCKVFVITNPNRHVQLRGRAYRIVSGVSQGTPTIVRHWQRKDTAERTSFDIVIVF